MSTTLKLLPIHRVSTSAQAGDNGEGLERQRDATQRIIQALKAKPDLTVIALPAVEIVDVSGSDVDQTDEWRHNVLTLIEEPNVHIAVDSIDRILRADSFNFKVMQELLRTSTDIHSPGQVHDLSDPSDGFMAGLMALLGGREKAEIKRRMMAGREAARRRGEWPLRNSALPRGITYKRTTKTWGYNDAEAEVIKRVYHWFVVEGRRLWPIARDVGKPMQTISQYLKNPIYKGLLRWDMKRGEKYPNKRNGRQPDRKKVSRLPHEIIEIRVFGPGCEIDQLVNDQMWELAQRRLASNAKDWSRARAEGQAETWASGFVVSSLAPAGEVQENGFISFDLSRINRHHIYANGGPIGQRRYGCTCGRSDSGLDRCGFRSPRAEPVNKTIDAYLGAKTTRVILTER